MKLTTLLLLLGLTVPSASPAGEPFLEMTLRPLQIGEGLLHAEVTGLTLLGDDRKTVERLVVGCEIDGGDWKTEFVRGDQISLEYEVERTASRSFLFLRGKGERIRIEGSSLRRSCRCRGKQDEPEGVFDLELVSAEGVAQTETRVTGKSVFFPLRLFPFVFKGGRAELPDLLVARLAYPSNQTAGNER